MSENTKDYSIAITVKNNLLLSMMKSHEIDTPAELSRRSGVGQGEIGAYLRLMKPAYSTKTGEMRLGVKLLCDFFKCLPCHIFPEQHLHNALKTNTSSIEISMDELKSIPWLVSSGPDDALISEEFKRTLYKTLEVLTDKQQEVLKMRFGLDGYEHTLAEIGERFGVTSCRIRQIEQKALRILRSPKNEKLLANALAE
jgi:RNA polymerase sigma factor (sigma-70 family)